MRSSVGHVQRWCNIGQEQQSKLRTRVSLANNSCHIYKGVKGYLFDLIPQYESWIQVKTMMDTVEASGTIVDESA